MCLQALTGIRLVEKLERIGLETIMATTAAPMSTLTLQGALYTRRTLKSPMAQLTSLKSAISSPGMVASATFSVSSIVKASNSAAEKTPFTGSEAIEQDLGVPGRPGSGLLDHPPHAPVKKHQRTGGMVRPDLGTVVGSVPTKRSRDSVEVSPSPGTLGTISSLLFGRKGGLL
jgi:trafficking kinesin-binding protein 1